MSAAESLFDPGIQPERTELAWRRTALAIGVGSLLTIRVLPEVMGSALWILPGLLGTAFAVWLWVRAHARYLRFARVLTGRIEEAAPDAHLLFVVAAFVWLVGVLALVLVFAAST
ncbi:DUF202 domain-containing protein [Microbacterium sulfonylureivorans]|uniref:DUF202 domain-containing protein n=1 Tax=Microbacterium sulfonylureivorans TaxID=2486854 RepID=UPI000FD9E598|nr:DUF202 domain-containing protein [Microbacterium sulfonylureivorans]